MNSQNDDIQRYVDLMGVEKIKKKAGIERSNHFVSDLFKNAKAVRHYTYEQCCAPSLF